MQATFSQRDGRWYLSDKARLQLVMLVAALTKLHVQPFRLTLLKGGEGAGSEPQVRMV